MKTIQFNKILKTPGFKKAQPGGFYWVLGLLG